MSEYKSSRADASLNREVYTGAFQIVKMPKIVGFIIVYNLNTNMNTTEQCN